MGQVPSKYFLPSAPYGASEAANALNPSQPAAMNPQTPLIPPNFTDPGTTIQGQSQAMQSSLPSSGGGFSGGIPFYGGNQGGRMFGRGLFGLALLLFFAVSSFATTTVTGTIQNLGTGAIGNNGAFVRFWLRGCGGNQPRVNGTSVIGPSQGGVFFFDLAANSSGVVSGTIYSTRDVTGLLGGDIECGGSKTSVWYGMQIFVAGKGGPEVPIHALNTATLDISNITPITTNPVVTAPTGDGTYIRKDGGNNPVTGSIQFNGGLSSSGTATLTGALNATNTNTFDNLNKVIYWDGSTTYPFTTAGLQAAINAACNGTLAGKVILPPFAANGVVTATITVPSLCWVDGAGKYGTVLQAATALNAPVMSSVGTSHVRLTNFTLNGNRSDNSGTNTNTFDCLDMGSGTSDVLIDSLRWTNCRNNGLLISASSGSNTSNIGVSNYESDHNGNGTITSIGTAGISIAPGTGAISRIRIGPQGWGHDNNGGIIVTNSSNSANSISDVSIFENIENNNGNDGIAVLANNASGGPMLNISVKGNQTFCNGDSTTKFPAACMAGFFQTHATNSPGGVGIDIIPNGDQLITQPLIEGNTSHDNTFEAIALSTFLQACVNVTTLTTVTQTTAANCSLAANQPFKTNWKASQTLSIGGTLYRISSCASTTVCTLTDNATNGNNQTAGLPTYMWAHVVGNENYNEGNNASGVGPGIFIAQTDGNILIGNSSRTANYEGIECFGCNFNTFSGNKAYSNDTSNTANRHTGIANYGGLGNQFLGETADDPLLGCGGSACQTTGLFIGAAFNGGVAVATNTVVESSSLYGTVAPVTDNGSNSQINTGLALSLPNTITLTANGANPASGVTAITNQAGVGLTLSTGSSLSLRQGGAQIDQFNSSGLLSTYNSLATAGQGISWIPGATSQKAETGSADANVLTVTPAAAVGTYRACFVASVSSATAGVISWTLSWTDSNGNAQANIAQDLFQQGTAAPNTTFTTSAAGNYNGCTTFDVNNAAANIVVKWVGGGTTAAKVSATVERLI